MSIQRMRQFVVVADEGTFGRAAERLGMAQPPLSQSIQRLERELGVVLFERTRKGVLLTPAGAAYLPEARAAVSAADRAVSLARAAAKTRKPIRVGMVSVAIWGPLRSLLHTAKEMTIPIELIAATTNDQLQALAHGQLDIGFVAPPFEAPPRMTIFNLASEPVMAAVPVELAQALGSIPLRLLAKRLIIFPRSEGPTLYDAIFAMFRMQGLRPMIVQQSPRMLSTLALVAAGFGTALVPRAIARSLTVTGVEFRPIDFTDTVPIWPLALVHMPLAARSGASQLLARWRREVLQLDESPPPAA